MSCERCAERLGVAAIWKKNVEIRAQNRFLRESSFLFYVRVDQLPSSSKIAIFAPS